MASADTICLLVIILAAFSVGQETGMFGDQSSEDEFSPDTFHNKEQPGGDEFQHGEDSFDNPRGNRRFFHSPMALFSFPQRHRIHPNRHIAKSSKSAKNILGSGNFGIIRGGIFPDHEGLPPTHHTHSNHNTNNVRRTDFFQDFHDFRPSRVQLNNALSSREKGSFL